MELIFFATFFENQQNLKIQAKVIVEAQAVKIFDLLQLWRSMAKSTTLAYGFSQCRQRWFTAIALFVPPMQFDWLSDQTIGLRYPGCSISQRMTLSPMEVLVG
jgi:hypothetical protein